MHGEFVAALCRYAHRALMVSDRREQRAWEIERLEAEDRAEYAREHHEYLRIKAAIEDAQCASRGIDR